MAKCAVIIGVNNTGGLPALNDAVSNAIKFNDWAVSQRFRTTLLTDQNGPVSADMIRNAVAGYVDARTATQLIIYFSGHGLLKGPMDEFWLLSDAPQNPDAAISLQTSRFYSRSCGIPHVVFISDACRTRATTAEQFGLRGSVIFSYSNGQATIPDIDMFYATAPGDPALEVDVTHQDITTRQSLYTRLLLEGLHGRVPEVIQAHGQNNLVMSYELSQYLKTSLPAALRAQNIMRNQRPDAEITSRAPLHLSKFRNQQQKNIGPNKGNAGKLMQFEKMYEKSQPLANERIFRDTMEFSNRPTREEEEYIGLFREASIFEKPIANTGFLVIGATVINRSRGESLNSAGGTFMSLDQERPGLQKTCFVQIENGTIYPLAVLPGYIGTAIFKEGILLNVNYTPSQNSPKYDEYLHLHEEIERRRALIAVHSKNGTFRIDGNNSYLIEAASYYRYLKEFDPTLGVYASYAYLQAGNTRGVESVYQYMAREPEPVLYDVALLRDICLNNLELTSVREAASFCPVLAQGWSYLALSKYGYNFIIQDFAQHLIPGLWTSFRPEAYELINKYQLI